MPHKGSRNPFGWLTKEMLLIAAIVGGVGSLGTGIVVLAQHITLPDRVAKLERLVWRIARQVNLPTEETETNAVFRMKK